jgi:hypothetical protein
MSTQDGGQAFPHAHEDYEFQRGMTLRDYFAAQALNALIITNPNERVEHLAEGSYSQADAMLAERARKEAQP